MPKCAVVLLSGGLDSATVLAMAAAQGFETCAISFRYGQRHEYELQAAAQVARRHGARRHVVIEFDLRTFGGSALTADVPVPKDRSAEQMGQGIPVTYVPARNTIFLSFALAWAETLDCGDIFIGVNALDYSGYPDCRPRYIEAFQRMANLATRAGDPDDQGSDHPGRAGVGRGLRADQQLLRPRARRPALPALRCLPASGQGLC
jgi:7-cyano-7-deazaguanine synthase